MQPLQILIRSTIRIAQESLCLPYAGFLDIVLKLFKNICKFQDNIYYQNGLNNAE